MATILNDEEIKKLIGKVIIDGDQSSIRPNAYILRLGCTGEFLNVGKEFTLGKSKKGIQIPPGHSAALTALEGIDFSRETVHQLYPDNDLHGFISPTTDLAREGIVAMTAQVDAGYKGTLNWTVSNTSNEERRFIYGERLFRLTIFKLGKGETPSNPYQGDYQGQTGYVRSRRKGPPVGMRSDEWETPIVEGSPEMLLDNLMKSGYPWHALGQRLKIIDQEFKAVTEEYGQIHDSISKLNREMEDLTQQSQKNASSLPATIRSVLHEEAGVLQNRWLIATAAMLVGFVGLALSFASNATAFNFLKNNGAWIGLVLVIVCILGIYIATRRPNKLNK